MVRQIATDDDFRTVTEDLTDELARGDIVEVRYDDADDPMNTIEHTAVVCKGVTSKAVLLIRDSTGRKPLRTVSTRGGHVKRNNREGNGRTYKVGDNGKIRRTGDRVDVDYKHHYGYYVEDDE